MPPAQWKRPVSGADVSNAPELFLQLQFLELVDGQRGQQCDAPLQGHEGFTEGFLDRVLAACDGCGVFDTPMRRHGLAWPDRAHLARGLVVVFEAEAELEAGGGSGGKGPSVQLIRLCSGRTMISLKYYSSITKNDISKPKRRRNQLS